MFITFILQIIYRKIIFVSLIEFIDNFTQKSIAIDIFHIIFTRLEICMRSINEIDTKVHAILYVFHIRNLDWCMNVTYRDGQ